jgi:predicted Rossmann fold nucleotide-binding protein DprA/Smf involved in DNA uptake
VLSSPTLAILSSRTLTETTVSATVTIAQQAARERLTVVSGGMKGAYRIAALAARAACRAIVLDRGLFAALGESLDRDSFGLGPGRATLDASRTLVLSPFRPNNHAAPGNGRRRDELVAALADIVVAVHARPGGEMERTCLRALDRGQCVLSWNAENAGLIEAGALPLDEADLRRGLNRYLSGMRDER